MNTHDAATSPDDFPAASISSVQQERAAQQDGLKGSSMPLSQEEAIRSMFDSIADRYDLANTLLSFGLHHRWKLRAVRGISPSEKTLDVCTGTGDLLSLIAKREGEVYGIDTSLGMLKHANQRFPGKAVGGDAVHLPFNDNVFDNITISFGIRNIPKFPFALKEFARVLKPTGTLRILEFGQPSGLWGLFFRFYSKYILPVIGGLITGNRAAYEYLPTTSAVFPAGEKLQKLIENNGFARCEFSKLTGGICYLYVAKGSI